MLVTLPIVHRTADRKSFLDPAVWVLQLDVRKKPQNLAEVLHKTVCQAPPVDPQY